MSNSVYDIITDKVINAMGNGVWERPWKNVGQAIKLSNGTTYNGLNEILLAFDAMILGHRSPVWGTMKQWNARGCSVKKGATSTMITFYNMVERENEDGKKDTIPVLRYYRVFNASDVEGFDEDAFLRRHKIVPQNENEKIESAEQLIRSVGPKIVHENLSRAFYSPARDYINVPKLSNFRDSDSYYSTLFHELTHWTGHPTRCDREMKGGFGTPEYAFEELVAELGAAFLCMETGISREPRPDHAAYIKAWIKALKNDNKYIFKASRLAQKAVKWIKEQG